MKVLKNSILVIAFLILLLTFPACRHPAATPEANRVVAFLTILMALGDAAAPMDDAIAFTAIFIHSEEVEYQTSQDTGGGGTRGVGPGHTH